MVMVWNYQDTVAQDSVVTARVVVKGLPAGVKQVHVREWAIDDKHSNAYTAWKQMGSPAQLSAEEAAQLQAAGQLQEVGTPKSVAVVDGAAKLQRKLPGESVSFYEVSW
jgi:xylan 1,4-beta-xylosidase